MKFSCISVHILTYYFYVFVVKRGGGSDGLSLRFILFLLHGLCGANRLRVLPIHLYRVRLTQYSCIDAFVVGPHHTWMYLLRFTLLQDEY